MPLNKWDQRFMSVARLAATWSKDQDAQVGAVIVDSQGQIAGVGYNGFAKMVEDTAERYGDNDTKLAMIVHAEENAVLGAMARARGATIYVTGKPVCARCAGTIIQAGVTRMVADPPRDKTSKWFRPGEIAIQMMKEAGIDFVPSS